MFDVLCGANLGPYILQVRQRCCSGQRSWRTAFQRAWGFGCRTHHCNLLHFVSLSCRKCLARRGFGSPRAALSTLGILRNWRSNRSFKHVDDEGIRKNNKNPLTNHKHELGATLAKSWPSLIQVRLKQTVAMRLCGTESELMIWAFTIFIVYLFHFFEWEVSWH